MSQIMYRGFRLERMVNTTWIRTEVRNTIPRSCRSLISGWFCHYPDGDGAKWANSLEEAKTYIDNYLSALAETPKGRPSGINSAS